MYGLLSRFKVKYTPYYCYLLYKTQFKSRGYRKNYYYIDTKFYTVMIEYDIWILHAMLVVCCTAESIK